MNRNKWIWIGMTVLVIVLTAAVIGVNAWYNSGNVRVMAGKLRVEMSGVGYIISQETGEIEGQTLVSVNGKTLDGDKETFDGDLEILDYYNEADGTVTTTKAVTEGADGYWEIHHLESCKHYEEDENGNMQAVNHSCRYRFIYYVHPDKQDFLVVRVKDKNEMYPVYVVLADSEEEALQIFNDFRGDKF